MRFLRHLGVILLLLVSSTAPLMACMAAQADVQMSSPERACCHMMKNQCGDMQMPASHGCCHKTLQSVDQKALLAKTVALPPLPVVVLALTVCDLASPRPVAAEWFRSPQYSPPQSPSSSISILRL